MGFVFNRSRIFRKLDGLSVLFFIDLFILFLAALAFVAEPRHVVAVHGPSLVVASRGYSSCSVQASH